MEIEKKLQDHNRISMAAWQEQLSEKKAMAMLVIGIDMNGGPVLYTLSGFDPNVEKKVLKDIVLLLRDVANQLEAGNGEFSVYVAK